MNSFTRSGKNGLLAAALALSVGGPGSLLAPTMATAQARGPSLGTRASDDTQRGQSTPRPADTSRPRQDAQPQRPQPTRPAAIPRPAELPRRVEPGRTLSQPVVPRGPFLSRPVPQSPPPAQVPRSESRPPIYPGVRNLPPTRPDAASPPRVIAPSPSPPARERYPVRAPYFSQDGPRARPPRTNPVAPPDFRGRSPEPVHTGTRLNPPKSPQRWLWGRGGDRRGEVRRHPHHFAYRGPYGPVYVPVYVPLYEAAPPPITLYEPGPAEVIVPAAPYDDASDPALALPRIVRDIEVAWEEGDLNLLMQHVSPYSQIEILENGELLDAYSRDEFRQHNADAFRRYQTVEMRFDRPELLSETEAIAEGIHIYRDETGFERRVHVTYAFRKQAGRWWLVGVNFRGEGEEQGALPTSDRPVAAPASAPEDGLAIRIDPAEAGVQDVEPVAGPTEGPTPVRDVTLLWARKIRLAGLLAQPKPLRIATLRYRVGAGPATYDLDAMRGIVPSTVAWALYHRGDKTPVESGSTSLARMDAKAWVALRVLPTGVAQPALVTSRGKHLKATALPVHWIAAGQSLTLYETTAP